MKDQLITHKTAELAHLKQFTHFEFSEKGMFEMELLSKSNSAYPKEFTPQWYKCTQSLLQRWLREKHDIHIEIIVFQNNTYRGCLVLDDIKEIEAEFDVEACKTYEDCLEKLLVLGLNRIK